MNARQIDHLRAAGWIFFAMAAVTIFAFFLSQDIKRNGNKKSCEERCGEVGEDKLPPIPTPTRAKKIPLSSRHRKEEDGIHMNPTSSSKPGMPWMGNEAPLFMLTP